MTTNTLQKNNIKTNTNNTIYYWCNDLNEMRSFYSGLVGLEEVRSADVSASRSYVCSSGDQEIVFIRSSIPLPIDVLDREPPSCVINVPQERFQNIATRLEAVGAIPDQNKKTVSIIDPMGTRLEISAAS